MARFRFFWLCFFVFFSLNAYASDFDQELVLKGDKFFEKKSYFKAEIFYDAFLLENDSCEIRFKSALCRYYTKRYEEALDMFSEISKNCEDRFLNASTFFLSNIYLELKEPGLFLANISNLEKTASDPDLKKSILNEKIWFYLRFGKTGQAISEIKKSDETAKKYFKLNELEREIPLLDKKVKSPVLSRIYSIIPGGGYLYCSRYKDAFFAFSINSLLAASAYEAFDNDLNLAGVLLASLTFGFYSGNIYGGIRAANVENNIYREKVYEDLESRFRKKGSMDFKLDFKIDF
ncbi:MAG: hypothetical protein RBR08_13535 [Desulforegulaceae bacterium]|nr:hypothetical protein [Desulforegulaceae bacterium]